MTLHYHQTLFDFLKIDPIFDYHRLEQVKILERQRSFVLPESLKEWLLIVNMNYVLTTFSTFDWVQNLENFASDETFEGLSERNQILMHERKVIPIFSERNGAWTWFVSLQTTEPDPKILLNVNLLPEKLISHPHRFSKEIFLKAWDFRAMHPHREGYSFVYKSTPPDAETLFYLRSKFREIATTFLLVVNETTLRFQKRDTFLAIVDNGIETTWHFFAQDGMALTFLFEVLAPLKEVFAHLTWIPTGDSPEDFLSKQTFIELLKAV